MDPIWIGIAFVLGFAARQVGLPPLVGFLAAGFVLNASGAQPGAFLQNVSELGITLLLFSIGLKLSIESLLRPQVWAVASIHMLITTVVLGGSIFWVGLTGLSVLAGLEFEQALLIAFALSFSSTVFAVKVLEEKGEMASLHGRVAIGILVIQDLVAVIFLASSLGKIPSPWALALLALWPLRHGLMKVMDRSGHGELLILYGLLLAVGVAALFESVGVKGDLGALIAGVLIARHPKASELARHLLGFKDLFLVGFFLSIGFSGVPSLETFGLAALLALLIPLKMALFLVLMARFQLRARTSVLASLSLANYSEFGLIVGTIAVANGWLSGEWLVVMALALSITLVLASPLNNVSHAIYVRFGSWLKTLETTKRLPYDQPIDPGSARIAVFGMGHVGMSAFESMRERYGDKVIGVDFDAEAVKRHQRAGRNVILGDATDPDFWARIRIPDADGVVAMLAMPNSIENQLAAEQLTSRGFKGFIAATAKYPDEMELLKKAGAHAVFNIYDEAGVGFAEHVRKHQEA